MLNVLLLIFGFGFVIFFHELGHFLAAKWADVRVEQFAVGFGQALLSWRKGIGFRFGNTQSDYNRAVRQAIEDKKIQIGKGDLPDGGYSDSQIAAAGTQLGLGETEYRLNWIPLGGYVKMVGQDDLDPNAVAAEPRAYNRKSIGKRMVIVSAGVIMNIILAFIGFMILFSIGFHAPAAVVGDIIPNSPAQMTRTLNGHLSPLMPGDTILTLDGKPQYDFTKTLLTTALLRDDHPTIIEVKRHRTETIEQLRIQPAFDQSGKFLMIGIRPGSRLEVDNKINELEKLKDPGSYYNDNWLKLKIGDRIIQVDGFPAKDQPIGDFDYALFDAKVQKADGKPVEVVWERTDGSTYPMIVQPRFELPFGDELNIAGLLPPSRIEGIVPDSLVTGILLPDDLVIAILVDGKRTDYPANAVMSQLLDDAGNNDKKVQFVVYRPSANQEFTTAEISPSMRVGEGGKRGVGIRLGNNDQTLVVADVMPGSPAETAGIPAGSRILSVNGTTVNTWFELRRQMVQQGPKGPLQLATRLADGSEKTFTISLTPEQVTWLENLRLNVNLPLADLITLRKTTNIAQAAWWGLVETKDFVSQFYLTLRRMVEGRVSLTNMQGPVGIFSSGTTFASRGGDWLLWFLCMISANLAVVNFLPIPIVDGGLFTFLVLEKIQGKPLSPKAQSIAQYVGLTLLISVFLIVTFMDLRRMLLF